MVDILPVSLADEEPGALEEVFNILNMRHVENTCAEPVSGRLF